MLLQHAWLAPLVKPETIAEEDEEEDEEAASKIMADEVAGDKGLSEPTEMVVDKEVADWVKGAIEKRKKGHLKGAEKPALHAAPLDAVQSPSHNLKNSLDEAPPVAKA